MLKNYNGHEEVTPIPAGSVPNNSETPTSKSDGETTQASESTGTSTQSTIKIGDKEYGSPEELAKAYTSLEKKLGSQGSEVGELRKQNQLLMRQMEQALDKQKATETQQQAPKTDYEALMADIKTKVDSGDLSIEEALFQSNQITAQMAEERALSKAEQFMSQQLQQRDAQSIQKDFLKENPDFLELQQSGALEQVKASNPLHDDLSAYYALQAQQAYERGKMEQAALKEGAARTDKVLTKPGSTIRQENKKRPSNPSEMKKAMLAALQSAGGDE